MFKRLRKNKNITQEMLAKRLGVAQNTVSNWETGDSKPDIVMVSKLAKILECDVSEVIACFVPEEEETAAV